MLSQTLSTIKARLLIAVVLVLSLSTPASAGLLEYSEALPPSADGWANLGLWILGAAILMFLILGIISLIKNIFSGGREDYRQPPVQANQPTVTPRRPVVVTRRESQTIVIVDRLYVRDGDREVVRERIKYRGAAANAPRPDVNQPWQVRGGAAQQAGNARLLRSLLPFALVFAAFCASAIPANAQLVTRVIGEVTVDGTSHTNTVIVKTNGIPVSAFTTGSFGCVSASLVSAVADTLSVNIAVQPCAAKNMRADVMRMPFYFNGNWAGEILLRTSRETMTGVVNSALQPVHNRLDEHEARLKALEQRQAHQQAVPVQAPPQRQITRMRPVSQPAPPPQVRHMSAAEEELTRQLAALTADFRRLMAQQSAPQPQQQQQSAPTGASAADLAQVRSRLNGVENTLGQVADPQSGVVVGLQTQISDLKKQIDQLSKINGHLAAAVLHSERNKKTRCQQLSLFIDDGIKFENPAATGCKQPKN